MDGPDARSEEQRGDRNGAVDRPVTSQYGMVKLRVPRARLQQDPGTSAAWHSHVLPRNEPLIEAVNVAVRGASLGGTNTPPIRRAREPLVGAGALSKRAISRIVGRLKADFEPWWSWVSVASAACPCTWTR